MRACLIALVVGAVVLVGCSSGGSTTAVKTHTPPPSARPAAANREPAADVSDPPLCGVKTTASMPAATRAFVAANRTRNTERARIDEHLASEGDLTSVDDVRAQLASDTEYAAALRAISFPPDAEALLADYLDQLGRYDAGATELVDEVGRGVDFPTAYSSFKASPEYAAAGAFTEASARLRENLGVPQSTCIFRTP
ncbi:MAG: hypothetical protein ACXVLO_12590 [Acidimicrobiia bacterium]